MKNREILILARAGVMQSTSNTVGAKEAYLMYRFRTWLSGAWMNLVKAEGDILDGLGIDGKTFDDELQHLRTFAVTDEEKEKLGKMEATLVRFKEMRDCLYDEEVEVCGVKPMDMESWFTLRKENVKDGAEVFGDAVTGILEGVLWKAEE